MTFLYPWFLAAGGLAALAILGLHVISWKPREPDPFPTLRFVPEGHIRSSQIKARLSDLWLMVQRLLIVLLMACVLAQPRFYGDRTAEVLLVDLSASVARSEAWEQSLRDREADVILGADGEAIQRFETVDEALQQPARAIVAPLAPALEQAIAQARKLAVRPENAQITIVSAFTSAAFENQIAAFDFKGRIVPQKVALSDREALSLNDAPDEVVFVWKDSPFWRVADVEGAALYGHGRVASGPFDGKAQLMDSLTELAAQGVVPVLWWSDGTPAAVERRLENRAEIHFGFAEPVAGDVSLRPGYRGLMAYLSDPLRVPLGYVAVTDADLADALISNTTNVQRPYQGAFVLRWLALLALLLTCAEPVLRRRLSDKSRVKEV